MFDKAKNKFLHFIAIRRTKINVSLGVFIVIFAIIGVALTNKENLDFDSGDLNNWWNHWMDPIFGFSTYLVAIVIWLSNAAKYWEERLDKKLIVSYRLSSDNYREVIRCEDAFLAHEGDIRNWGQALGQQSIGKNKQHRLVYFDFSNTIEVQQPKIVSQNGEYFKRYTAIFQLKNLPKDELENGYDLRNGKFVWQAGAENAQFFHRDTPDLKTA